MRIKLISEATERPDHLTTLAKQFGLEHQDNHPFALVDTGERIELRKLDEPKLGAVYVDFASGSVAHRRKFGGGKGQDIAKAVGISKGGLPSILDATAGLGRDSFIFASLGSHVHMIERNPMVAMLLSDGLERAKQDREIGAWVTERMSLSFSAGQLALESSSVEGSPLKPDVVYLDPMYPHAENKKNSALVKKEMRVFQSVVGADNDADALLQPALTVAQKRVVVKRPNYAPWLADKKPSMSIKMKKNRFDVYVLASMT
ncbi:class I SAM-dependent methyltransferase [Vibrio sp. S4M6]|uniref:class I SAM-dependent methyltransferase n=1 Tax=Vibrio sinus TaxID=2946865 RepID=UPI00202AB83C|nr:class I SAM-dependent methyltransferase [Vibrio sinus]MCL9782864.1 class I SAM-dependent methyltransferase [Vibrio sinus]